jgi:ElaB/YqjD/DUF883 family membrane-anchored ribosome-binding protein
MDRATTEGSRTVANEQRSDGLSPDEVKLHHKGDASSAAYTSPSDSSSVELKALRSDLNNLKDIVTNFIARTTSGAAKSARDLTTNITEQAGDIADRGADVASAASTQAKNLANEFEAMARRNPLGVVAGALLVGGLIGMMGRRS